MSRDMLTEREREREGGGGRKMNKKQRVGQPLVDYPAVQYVSLPAERDDHESRRGRHNNRRLPCVYCDQRNGDKT